MRSTSGFASSPETAGRRLTAIRHSVVLLQRWYQMPKMTCLIPDVSQHNKPIAWKIDINIRQVMFGRHGSQYRGSAGPQQHPEWADECREHTVIGIAGRRRGAGWRRFFCFIWHGATIISGSLDCQRNNDAALPVPLVERYTDLSCHMCILLGNLKVYSVLFVSFPQNRLSKELIGHGRQCEQGDPGWKSRARP